MIPIATETRTSLVYVKIDLVIFGVDFIIFKVDLVKTVHSHSVLSSVCCYCFDFVFKGTSYL